MSVDCTVLSHNIGLLVYWMLFHLSMCICTKK